MRRVVAVAAVGVVHLKLTDAVTEQLEVDSKLYGMMSIAIVSVIKGLLEILGIHLLSFVTILILDSLLDVQGY